MGERVDVEGPPDLGVLRFEDRLTGHDAGVVDQDVYRAPVVEHVPRRGIDGVGVGDIATVRTDPVAAALDLAAYIGQRCLVDVPEDHTGAPVGDLPGQ